MKIIRLKSNAYNIYVVQCKRLSQMEESILDCISVISASLSFCIFSAVAILPLCGCALLPWPCARAACVWHTQDVTNAHLISCWTLALISLTAPLLCTVVWKQHRRDGRWGGGGGWHRGKEEERQHDRGKRISSKHLFSLDWCVQ